MIFVASCPGVVNNSFCPILHMQRLSLKRSKGTQGHDSEWWHLDLCGVLTSCIPFSCSQQHTLATFSVLLAFLGALQDPASAPLSFYRRRRGHSPIAKRVSSTLAISALAIIPKFKNRVLSIPHNSTSGS